MSVEALDFYCWCSIWLQVYCTVISHLIASCQQRFSQNLQNVKENDKLFYTAVEINGYVRRVSSDLDEFEYSR